VLAESNKGMDETVRVVETLNLRVADLRAETHTVCTSKIGDDSAAMDLLRKAEAMEHEYYEWHQTLPDRWKPTAVSWVEGIAEQDYANAKVYPGRVDSYGEAYVATIHNIARSARLFIVTTILRCTAKLCYPLDYRMTPEYVTASRHASQLIDDIIATTPYFFGWNCDAEIAVFGEAYFPCGDNRITGKGVTGIWAMYPLFAASASDFATYSQRIWMRGRLEYISEVLGVNQAHVLLQLPVRYPSTYIARDRAITGR